MSERNVIDCPVDTVKCDKCLKIYILQSDIKNTDVARSAKCAVQSYASDKQQKDKNSPEFVYVCERAFEVRNKREVMLAAQ